MEIVFLFPGQGAQSKGMLDAFVRSDESPVVQTLEEASDALGYDMAALVHEDAEDKLNRTEYTQPALLAASIAICRLWRHQGGVEPSHVAGHSLGEYSALVAAGSLDFTTAVQLVAFRGKEMAEAVPAGEGRMAAILGLDDEAISNLCGQASTEQEKAWPANFNCPGQLVIAGHAAAVDRAMEAATKAGAKRALPLAVSAPSHTPLMQPAADAIKEKLKDVDLKAPACPVWSNAEAAPLESEDKIREALVRQLVTPVRWTEIIQRMRHMGVSHGVEMGPGKVLTGLVKRIERDFLACPTFSPEQMKKSLEQMHPGG
ncbi:MAG: ACP S-malonyltransferase [Mariprofundaceae bacterium]